MNKMRQFELERQLRVARQRANNSRKESSNIKRIKDRLFAGQRVNRSFCELRVS
jgi:hypothetical protein